jgi:serine/threonine protein kinase
MSVRAADVGPLTGPLIAGRFSLGDVLGSGGAAIVRRGWDVWAERPVALKFAREERTSALQMGRETNSPSGDTARIVPLDTLRWRLKREGRILASLPHPHIARVYDYLEVEEWPWLALELVEGLDLRRAVSERGPLSPLAALAIGRQICAALSAIHAAGIIHRDVKPQNIILSPSGHATLIDFDLAWAPALGDDGEPGMVYGTPEYMAPEQAMGERITPATDLYSLGVTLYELLAGSAPFHTGRASAIMWRHVTETPPPLREWRHDLPAPVERTVMRALAKEPRRRYPSAEAMERALAQAESAARLAPYQRSHYALPALVSRATDTYTPVPTPIRQTPAFTPLPNETESALKRWLRGAVWALALVGLMLALVIILVLAQSLPT